MLLTHKWNLKKLKNRLFENQYSLFCSWWSHFSNKMVLFACLPFRNTEHPAFIGQLLRHLSEVSDIASPWIVWDYKPKGQQTNTTRLPCESGRVKVAIMWSVLRHKTWPKYCFWSIEQHSCIRIINMPYTIWKKHKKVLTIWATFNGWLWRKKNTESTSVCSINLIGSAWI